MLSLSKRTDYALLALSHLARSESDRAVSTKEIADRYGIPLELLAKILQLLVRAELLVSTAGPSGGYRLARAPETISVAAVVELIDGAPALMPCLRLDGANDCDQIIRCTIRGPLARINARISEMLQNLTLAEISVEDDAVPPGLPAAVPFLTGQALALAEENTQRERALSGARPNA